ncbi:hypothetical protein BJX68DRAFT_266279 [Aspergillus pseudodeflectus]|uniref:Uncharacterized protein n=1 Tax=Aspergillus pseudodeflectus TaxID=176178 RepID=A0ABR4KJA0_9EURO
MSTTNNTTTCAKCGRVFAPAGQGNCTLKCCPLWTDHAGALERLGTSIQQSGGKVTDAATATFVAAREDNLTKEVQRQSPEPKEPANGEGAAEMTTADVDRIIAEKQRVVDNALSEIADLECKVIENDVARGRLRADDGKAMMEVLRGVNEKSKQDSRKRLEEEKKSLLKKVSKK